VLTFDDGYRDFYTHAFSVLKEYGFTATVFLPTSFIDNKKVGLKGKKHLSWPEVRELKKMGIGFGSHTVTHRQLIELDEATIRSELKVSKEKIEDEINGEVKNFSYPYRFPEHNNIFVGRIKELLNNCGYICGTGTRIGTTHQPAEKMILKRIPVNSADDLDLLSAKLSGNYDWLHRIQCTYKMIISGR
jgi:peptidoglycan/xylan/chitin deacetylase (PgdA/CDA1 family)